MPTDNIKKTVQKPQNLILENCKKLVLSGVNEVVSFDEEAVSLETELGRLEIRGNNMQIISFDTQSGDMNIEGYVYALVYTKSTQPKSIFRRVFK